MKDRSKYLFMILIIISLSVLSCGDSSSKKNDNTGNTEIPSDPTADPPTIPPADTGSGFTGMAAPSYSATRYVRQGASGLNDGSDWTNAFPGIPAMLERGTVYYISEGDYGTVSIDSPVSAAEYICIRKAIQNDHGTESGWSSSYGDDTTNFEQININTSYVEVDGQTGGGPESWTSGHGFVITGPWADGSMNNRLINFADNISNVIVSHIEMKPEVVHQGFGHCFRGLYVSNIKIDHCCAHDNFGCFILIRDSINFLVEFSYFSNNLSTAEFHSEFLSETGSDNMTFRYNFFKEIDGTAVFAGVNGDADNPSEYREIYGNIITDSTHFIFYYFNPGNDENIANNWKIYNNTIKNTLCSDMNGHTSFANYSEIKIYNNLWYNFQDGYFMPGQPDYPNYIVITKDDTDYNSFYDCDFRPVDEVPSVPHNENGLSGDPFADSANDDFHLNSGTTDGFHFDPPYNVDMYGRVRGADGVWDRGAVEY